MHYVEGFKQTKGRFPTRDEFWGWIETSRASGIADYAALPKDEYEIFIWVGEKMLIYSSKDKNFREQKAD